MTLTFEQLEIQLGDLSFHYSGCVESGITGVFGVSGSGKSTLMKLICGIERPTRGRMVYNDTVLFDADQNIYLAPHLRRVGVVFQEHFLFPHLTVEQNLTFGMRYNSARHMSFSTVVQLLHLESLLKKKPNRLSGGERQRTAIGRSLLQQPELLLLDEPFSNLDRLHRREITSYLLRIQHCFHIPMLIISHDLEDILRLTQSLIVIDEQVICAEGTYLSIAERGILPHLISPKRFINSFELIHQRYDSAFRHHIFGTTPNSPALLTADTSHFENDRLHGHRVKMCIAPDDIALSRSACNHVSIQNQLPGTVTSITHMNDSFYVTVDCGVELLSEITPRALYQLDIKLDSSVFCLFKAKAVDVIHIYES